ncbi:sensor histidine kinase [Streptomyces sp. NPDC002513]
MSTTRSVPGAHEAPGAAPGGDVLPWTRHDALVAVGAAAIDLIGFGLTSQADQGQVPAVGYVLLVLSALPLLARRRLPVPTLGAVLLFGLVLNLTVPMAQHFNATVAVALYTVVRSRGPAVAVPAALVAVTVPLVGQTPRPGVVDLCGTASAGALVSAAALVMNRWERNIAANRRLLADRAVADERRRIARELHDIVAHHITTMQLMAGGARANLGGDRAVVEDALVTLEKSGRVALREMRQMLDVLRTGDEPAETPTAPQPGVGDLERVVAESCRAGLPTVLDVRGEDRPLSPGLSLTVFRIVQEALTNAHKHAGEARASVRLAYGPDAVTVEVSDDGAGVPAGFRGPGAGAGSGYGLIGMRERALLHDGTLEAGPLTDGGFRVTARLPLTADEGSAAMSGAAGEGAVRVVLTADEGALR